MNDANLVFESTSEMSQTLVGGSDSVQWKPITTISVDAESVLKTDEASTAITDGGLSLSPDKNKWVMAIVIIAINLLVTWVFLNLVMNRQDGMQRLGWAENNKIILEGKERLTYLPIYVAMDDYKELNK